MILLSIQEFNWYILGAALLIWLGIIYNIIRSAVSTTKQLWNQKATINILIKIAEKLDASDEELREIKKQNNAVEKGFFDM